MAFLLYKKGSVWRHPLEESVAATQEFPNADSEIPYPGFPGGLHNVEKHLRHLPVEHSHPVPVQGQRHVFASRHLPERMNEQKKDDKTECTH